MTISSGQPLILHNLTLLDMVRDAPLPDAVVVVDGPRILEVGRRADFGSRLDGSATMRIDAAGAYVMPGLVESHAHLLSAFIDRFGGQELLKLQPDATLAFCCERIAADALHRGITMIRVVGEARYLDIHLRNAIEQGLVVGPRLFVAGRLIIRTGGHGQGAINTVSFDGPAEAVKTVRAELAAGADFIKLMISGGVASRTDPVDVPQLMDKELAAAVTAARQANRTVAAHAGGSRLIERAVRLGVTSIEHGYVMDEAAVGAMVECGAYLVPTLVVSHDDEYIGQRASWIQEKARSAAGEHLRAFQRARAAGVKIAAGSDVPDFPEYFFHELDLLRSHGMSGFEVLAAATRTPAEMCGLADRLGTIQPGKLADLIAVEGDPREPRNLRNVRLVIKDGAVVRNALPASR